MNFSTLFRTKENLNLDKSTLTILRYIAIFGQFTAVNIVFFYLDLKFPIKESYIIVSIGLLTNLFLQFKIKVNQLKDTYASLFLLYDLFQLSALLYLTGGILNPFVVLLIIPTVVSSTFLSMGTTIILGVITSFLLFLLTYTHLHLPLPGVDTEIFEVPNFYKQGILIAILIGLIFLSYFGIRFAGETKKRSEALNKLQEVISKEYELESLGGQAAAAAHSLGTPLATITVVAKELKKEIGDDKEYSKDIDLLISQTKRCSDILKQISKKQIEEDIFLSSIKFSKSKVKIYLKSNDKEVTVNVTDDGPGFPDDIFNFLGEPYIKSKSKETSSNAGLGLGTFLGKTLLEKQGAKLSFKSNQNGAEVKIDFVLSKLIS